MKLLALRCPQCAQALAPQHPEVIALSCAQCGTAVSLSQSSIQPLAVQYAAPASEEVKGWLPLWLFHGRVHLQRRQSQGSSGGQDKAAAELWQRVQRLYVPAWEATAGQARAIGAALLQQQPQFQPIPQPADARLQEAIISPEEGLKMVDFIVISIEAGRKDMLRDLTFEVEAGQPELWAIPGRRRPSGWQLAAAET